MMEIYIDSMVVIPVNLNASTNARFAIRGFVLSAFLAGSSFNRQVDALRR